MCRYQQNQRGAIAIAVVAIAASIAARPTEDPERSRRAIAQASEVCRIAAAALAGRP